MPLGEPLSVGADNQTNVHVVKGPKPEKPLQVLLAGGNWLEIDTPKHLRHPLQFVVDHHRQVVSRDTVVALKHDIINQTRCARLIIHP